MYSLRTYLMGCDVIMYRSYTYFSGIDYLGHLFHCSRNYCDFMCNRQKI